MGKTVRGELDIAVGTVTRSYRMYVTLLNASIQKPNEEHEKDCRD